VAEGQPAYADGIDRPAAVPQPREVGSAAPVHELERMPAACFLLDPALRVRYANAEGVRLAGRPRTGLVGRTLQEVFPGIAGPAVERACRAAVADGEAATLEPVSSGSGHTAAPGWYEVHVWPAPDGAAVCLRDVSAHQRTAESIQRATTRSGLLARLSAELPAAGDGESALARLAQLVVPTLTDACIVTVVDRDGRARDVASWHTDPRRRELLELYTDVRLESLPEGSPVDRALRTGTAVREAIDEVLALLPPGRSGDLLRALRPASVVVLPLVAEARTVGVLTLYLDDGRTMDDDDLLVAGEVAGLAARAIERVHRASQQEKLAEALQRSLLTAPPPVPGIDVAVRYVPAAEAARVGGDWYDAFLLRDGTPVVVIGDVTGHDTAAAAAMGQLRGLLRGVAHAGTGGPAEVLTAFDEAVVAMHPDTLATAALARIERSPVGPVLLCWASAGHPPPALLRVGGSAELLGGRTGELLLGVDPGARRTDSTVSLAPGDTVLLYTDGLVERHDASFDEGTSRLVAVLQELRGEPLEGLCDALLRRMLPGTPADDVALVAVRVQPVPDTPVEVG
jgi:serine phosphatase RsbU (regulator of sigma subunit)/PAS domain-containing protein